jgi:hypothetical protein
VSLGEPTSPVLLDGPKRIPCGDRCPRCATGERHEARLEVWLAMGPAHDRAGELGHRPDVIGAVEVSPGKAMVRATIIEYIVRI